MENLQNCLNTLSKHILVKKYHPLQPKMCQTIHFKLFLDPRQSSEINHPDYWHTCPRMEMLEAVQVPQLESVCWWIPPEPLLVADASSCSRKLALLPICAGGGSKSDKSFSLSELKCPVLGACHLAQVSKPENCFYPK